MSSEQINKRNRNRYAILRAIQTQGPLKRSEIARLCGIRKSSITGLVREMTEMGVLCSENPERLRSPLAFTADKWFAVSANVTEKEIQLARVDLTGQVTGKKTTKLVDNTYETIEDVLVSGVEELLAKSSKNVLGVAVSLPGIIDPDQGLCCCSINVPQLNNKKIRSTLQDKLGVDVVIENDVRASLWASVWFEHLFSRYQDVLYLDITEGISSALLMDGKPHTGATFAAGEMGHLRAGNENRICRCGKQDCLEAYCSIDAIRKDILQVAPQLGDLETAGDIATAAADNVVVANVLDRAMERLSGLLAVLVAYIDPEIILLGNQDPRFYEAVVPFLKKHLALKLQGCVSREVEIQVVPAAKDSALRGVAGLVFDYAFREKLNS